MHVKKELSHISMWQAGIKNILLSYWVLHGCIIFPTCCLITYHVSITYYYINSFRNKGFTDFNTSRKKSYIFECCSPYLLQNTPCPVSMLTFHLFFTCWLVLEQNVHLILCLDPMSSDPISVAIVLFLPVSCISQNFF